MSSSSCALQILVVLAGWGRIRWQLGASRLICCLYEYWAVGSKRTVDCQVEATRVLSSGNDSRVNLAVIVDMAGMSGYQPVPGYQKNYYDVE
jgi:hypothetical protein